jgi:CDP-diglyceride synthetase
MFVLLAQAAFFTLPFVLAGVIHIAIIKYGLFKQLECIQLDGGLTINGRPLFGKNKTLRGAVTVIFSTTAFFVLEGVAGRNSPFIASVVLVNNSVIVCAGWGALLGVGCILGELPNSFLKRRLNIKPGAESGNPLLKVFFWIWDQVDSVLGVIILARIYWKPSWLMLMTLFVFALVIHPIGAGLMVRLGLKQSTGLVSRKLAAQA